MGRGRGIIVGRKCPKIQNCPTCGRMRCFHKYGYYKCDTPNGVITALLSFKKMHGARWKSILCKAWMNGEGLGSELQLARNIIGPKRLYKLSI